MRRLWFVILVFVVVVALPGLSGAQKADKKVPELMQRKLKHSQKLLEALALNDFGAMAKNAEELIQVSKDAEWRVVKTPRYELFSDQFRSHAEEIVKHAKNKNLDGAALSYVELTLSCVKCHKYVRDVRMTELENLKGDRGN